MGDLSSLGPTWLRKVTGRRGTPRLGATSTSTGWPAGTPLWTWSSPSWDLGQKCWTLVVAHQALLFSSQGLVQFLSRSPSLSLLSFSYWFFYQLCQQVFCLDYSRAALAAMKQLYEEMFSKAEAKKPAVHFVHGNATKMPFKKNTFDVVLDKGTTDSVLKFEDRTQAHLMAKKIQNEALRIISPNGVYIQITDEDPDMRLPLLRDNVVMDSKSPCDFSVSYRDISEDDSWQHFMYILSVDPDCWLLEFCHYNAKIKTTMLKKLLSITLLAHSPISGETLQVFKL